MFSSWKDRMLLAGLLLVGVAVFGAGIGWGLPSRQADRYLFGREPVWSGQKILELAGKRVEDRARGADVDVDPLLRRAPVWLNTTGTDRAADAARAAILIRYRLYTYQPDEMITMMSLASMHPGRGDLDPKLYQYGGLWIYPVGALLKIASLAGAVHLTTDQAWYLDHPEDFGRFYVVARLYVVFWGLLGIAAVWWLTRRLTGSVAAAATAAASCIAMPVVINMAHEAKPHLPGAVLMLWAVIAAIRYVDTGRTRWWMASAAACGAAFGMVLSSLPIFVLVPLMMLLRPQPWSARLGRTLAGLAIGAAVYLVTNPYILINAFTNREVLHSNFGNSLAMYEIGRWREGLTSASWLVAEGASIVLAVLGAIGAVAFAVGAIRSSPTRVARPQSDAADKHDPPMPARPAGLLLAAPVLLILAQFVALAAGKPGEYGRFAVFPDIALGIAAVAFAWRGLQVRDRRMFAMVMLVAFTTVQGYPYLNAFLRDSGTESSRMLTADRLQQLLERGSNRLAVIAEPAPYVMPPFNLFRWNMVLTPPGSGGVRQPIDALLNVDVSHDPAAAIAICSGLRHVGGETYAEHMISWADRAFELWTTTRPASEPASRAAQ